ncbi:patatin-like phospholipase family protein [Rhodoblastus sp.]|uniref:patatin-like phospholipase family protein n=1 Tax=Rhodoblastus sp. TaxID=1962975 RepID=UPI003F9B7B3C
MKQKTNTPHVARPPKKRRIAVALQGGGSHGAFTWGVLDRLLEEPSFEIVGISGTSAGAMNAGILADGLLRGGAPQAQQDLRRYWEDVGRLRGYASFWPFGPQRDWRLDNNPVFLSAEMLARIWSPYQTNPANHNPLRELLERIDFEGLRHDASAARVFVCATNVQTGLRRVFHNAELSPEVLLASACLPQCYQAVQIGEDFYWDGGYSGNPALAPLYLGTSATDLIVVGINPIQRMTVPQTARAIIDRIGEISFNSSFMMELAAVAFVEHLVKSSAIQTPLRLLHVHGIGDEALGSFGASSKMNNQWEFLQHLHEMGLQAADRWLATNRSAVGKRSTVDLSGLAPPKDSLLTRPMLRKKTQLSTSDVTARSA